jgi:hypothetical protein
MDTAITAVSQLVTEGTLRYGALTAVELPADLWEQVMEEVAAAGGQVGFEHCVVDGVAVRPLPDGEDAVVFVVAGTGRRETMSHGSDADTGRGSG